MSIKLMTAVWDSGALRGTELIVMLALADHANDDGECWPSISRLAQRARIKERAVQYALSSLEAQGQISRDVTGGKGRTSRYLLYPKGAENCTPAEAPKGAENCTPKVAKGCKATTQRVQSHDTKGATAIAPEPLRTTKEPSEARERARPPTFDENLDIRPDVARGFIAHRKALKKPLSERAMVLLCRELHRIQDSGRDPNDALDLAIERGWQGVKLDFIVNSEKRNVSQGGRYLRAVPSGEDPALARIRKRLGVAG